MRIPSHPTLLSRAIESRVRQLTARGPVLAASLVDVSLRCGRPGCRCEQGEQHPKKYVTLLVGGRTKKVYVPIDLVEEVRGWIREHKRLKMLVREITLLSIARIRGHVQARRRRRS